MSENFYLAETLIHEHMAEVRRLAARRQLLGFDTPPPQRRREGLIRRLLQAVSAHSLRRVAEKGASQ